MTTTYINRVELKGFVGADAHAKQLASGKTALNFAVATSAFIGRGDDKQQFVEWHRVAAWGRLAQRFSEMSKGSYVRVTGELRSREYTSADGTKVHTYDIVARAIELIERAGDRMQVNAA